MITHTYLVHTKIRQENGKMMEEGALPSRRMLENKCRSNRIQKNHHFVQHWSYSGAHSCLPENHHFAAPCVISDSDKDPNGC